MQKYKLSGGNAMIVSLQVQFPAIVPSLAQELVPSSQVMCHVSVQKPSLRTASAIDLDFVTTEVMLESPVGVSIKSQCSGKLVTYVLNRYTI